MSRGQRPRTPEHFPRMKDRAAGRRRRAVMRRYLALGQMGGAHQLAETAFDLFVRAMREAVRPITEAAQAVARSLVTPKPPRRSDYALAPAPEEDR